MHTQVSAEGSKRTTAELLMVLRQDPLEAILVIFGRRVLQG